MKYQQAVNNQWNIAYHRMKVAEDNVKNGRKGPCNCAECREHLEAMARGPEEAGYGN